MKSMVLSLVAAAALALPMAASAQSSSAGGLSPKQLGDAGWTCFFVPGLGVHCAPPGKWPPTDPEVQLLYFFNLSDPTSDVAGQLTGTETLIRDDIFNGQPCPTEPSGQYTSLAGLGLDYHACHRH